MANKLDQVKQTIYKQALPRLRKRFTFPRFVKTDFANETAQKGDPIAIRLPVEGNKAKDLNPSMTVPDGEDIEQEVYNLNLDRWKYTDFDLTDKEVGEILSGTMPSAVEDALDTLAKQVNTDLASLYKSTYHYHEELDGSQNVTTPFGSDISSIAAVDNILFNEGVEERRGFVLDGYARQNLLQRDQFNDASRNPDNAQRFRTGRLGSAWNFQFDADQQIAKHTAGSQSGDPTVQGSVTAGDDSFTIACDSDDTVAYKDGDIIEIGGESYAVKKDVTVGNSDTGTVELYPGSEIRADLSGGESVTLVTDQDHTASLAFGENAFALAVRRIGNNPFAEMGMNGNRSQMIMVDPVSRIPVRFQIIEGFGVTKGFFDILYGVGAPRPREAVRLAG